MAPGQSLEGVVKAVSKLKKGRVVLVLLNELPGETRHLTGSHGVVALNLGVMRPADMTQPKAEDLWMFRIDKEVVGGVATALGLPSCPFIRCALYPAGTVEELDAKARSLCPACMQKLEERLAEWRK